VTTKLAAAMLGPQRPPPAKVPTMAEHHSVAAVLEPVHVDAFAQYHASAEEADAGNHLARDAAHARFTRLVLFLAT
jgi:hypothetical protein